jgi:hypothetical protein
MVQKKKKWDIYGAMHGEQCRWFQHWFIYPHINMNSTHIYFFGQEQESEIKRRMRGKGKKREEHDSLCSSQGQCV